jgi:excisionase family DNA binding protein
MNLKTAARRLGVHYQTAYRYVRTGELVAVKVGGSYKISEAALEMMRQRLAAADEVFARKGDAPPTPGRALDDELDAMLQSTSLSAQPVFDLATRWLATEIGDGCILRLLSEDGQYAPAVSFFDRDPARRGLVAAYLATRIPKVSDLPTAELYEERRVLVEHHMEAPKAASRIPVQFRQYTEDLVAQSLASCTVRAASGDPIGALTLLRQQGGRPYSAEEVELLRHMAGKVEDAIARVERFSAAWVTRDHLYESVGHLFALDDTLTLAAVTDQLMDLVHGPLPQAVFDLDRQVVAASDSFLELFSEVGAAAEFDDVSLAECITCGADDIWSRLLSGANDFLVDRCGQCENDRRAQVSIHWVVVRRRDGTPVAVIAVCEPRPGSTPATTG